MRPSARLVATVLMAITVGLPSLATAAAAPTLSGAPQMTPSATSPARLASQQATSLRTDVAGMLQEYINAYGNRFTSAERSRLLGYRADADRNLAAVVAATRRLDAVTANGSSASVRRAAGIAAQSSWRRAKSAADTSFASARRIMEPKLSFVERLQALGDYNTMMGRFDELGATIDLAAANRRAT